MAFALIASASAPASFSGATTAAIDTTGADLLVLVIAAYINFPPSVADSKGNTWTPLTQRSTATDGFSRLYYCQGGTVGSGHTFSVNGLDSYSGIAVQAWSGSIASPFDVENGAVTAGATSLASGSVTPSNNDQLIVCGVQTHHNPDFNTAAAIDSGFTITSRRETNPDYAFGLAYLVQTSAGSVNPTWSWTTSNDATVVIATFKSSSGGGGGGGNPWYAYTQQRQSLRDRWTRRGLIWTPVAA